jgi:hypothetical protein
MINNKNKFFPELIELIEQERALRVFCKNGLGFWRLLGGYRA